MKKVIRIKNLDCAGCAAELEEELSKIDGVTFASVSFVNQKVTVQCHDNAVYQKVLYAVSHFEEVEIVEDIQEKQSKKRSLQWILIGVSAFFFLLGILFSELSTAKPFLIVSYIAFGVAYFAVGYPVLIATGKNLLKGKIFDENFLMTVASIGAVLLGEVFEGVAVMLLYQIGETLQAMAVDSSRKNIAELMDLKTEKANLVVPCENHACHELHLKEVSPEEIKIGDILLVKAGEKIPVDGELLDDLAILDTKSLTGEAVAVEYKKGEKLLSGCINIGKVFRVKATKLYQDSAVGKILDLVENASSQKAKPEKFIAKFARYYTPIVCILALCVAFVLPLFYGIITEKAFYLKDFSTFSKSALSFLVVSCPCALIISVPLTYFAGIGACARGGILVKGATYLDTLAKSEIIAFDKTGTLTEGNFSICGVYPNGTQENELLALISSVEKPSSHPIAKAFFGLPTPYTPQSVTEVAGKGLIAEIDGDKILVGNSSLLKENGVSFTEKDSAYTLIYAAKNGEYLGVVEVGDKLRDGAKTAVEELKKLGLSRTVMLTGDKKERAEKIAKEVGVYEMKAELLPDGKLDNANTLKKEGVLVYVGDGINDAPVMATADCAVSMGKLGSDASVEASDLVLISDDLTALVKAVKISRKTRKVVLENIVFSIAMKVVFMTLGAVGILPLYLAVFGDVGVMLLAVINSLRARKIK